MASVKNPNQINAEAQREMALIINRLILSNKYQKQFKLNISTFGTYIDEASDLLEQKGYVVNKNPDTGDPEIEADYYFVSWT